MIGEFVADGAEGADEEVADEPVEAGDAAEGLRQFVGVVVDLRCRQVGRPEAADQQRQEQVQHLQFKGKISPLVTAATVRWQHRGGSGGGGGGGGGGEGKRYRPGCHSQYANPVNKKCQGRWVAPRIGQAEWDHLSCSLAYYASINRLVH